MVIYSLLICVGIKLSMPTGYFVLAGIGLAVKFLEWVVDMLKILLE